MNIIEHTGNILYAVLKEQGEVSARQLRDEIVIQGGEPKVLPFSAKQLRNHGYPVATHRKGRYSVWYLAEDAEHGQEYLWQEIKNHFSEAVSIARASAGVRGPGVKAARDHAVGSAVAMGQLLGHSPGDVVEMCKPLPPMIARGGTGVTQ